MITDETKPGDFKNIRTTTDYSHIKGWGIDADKENDPVYPMKHRNNAEHQGYSWERPPLQHCDTEILKSVERPNLTAVYGSTAPPSGLSGKIRRMAYKYSESSYGRWLPLVLADRIGMVEGIIDDFKHGIVPNIPAERGWGAEWKHNRRNFVLNVATVAVITGAVVAYALSKKKKDEFEIFEPN